MNTRPVQQLCRVGAQAISFVAVLGISGVLVAACGVTDAGEQSVERGSDFDAYRSVLRGYWDEGAVREAEIRAEELVAECMAEVGFDYTPVPPDASAQITEVPIDEQEYAETYGFGVSFPVPGATLSPDVHSDEAGSATEGMTEAERLAYAEALYGPLDPSPTLSEGYMQGCQEQGYGTVVPTASLADGAMFDDLRAAMERLPDDPVIVELDHDWSVCMSDAGNGSFGRPRVAVQSIEGKFAGLGEMVETVGGALSFHLDEDELRGLQEEERELALASLRCREAVRYREREAAVVREIENDFVVRYRDELDAWLIWYEEQLP